MHAEFPSRYLVGENSAIFVKIASKDNDVDMTPFAETVSLIMDEIKFEPYFPSSLGDTKSSMRMRSLTNLASTDSLTSQKSGDLLDKTSTRSVVLSTPSELILVIPTFIDEPEKCNSEVVTFRIDVMETMSKSSELEEITLKLRNFGPFDFIDLVAKGGHDRELHIKRAISLKKQVRIVRPFSAFSRTVPNNHNKKFIVSFRLEVPEASKDPIQIGAIDVKVDNAVYPWISSADENIFEQEFRVAPIIPGQFPVILQPSEKYEWAFAVTKGLADEFYELPFDSSEYRFCTLISCKYRSSDIAVLFDSEIDLAPLFPTTPTTGYVIHGTVLNPVVRNNHPFSIDFTIENLTLDDRPLKLKIPVESSPSVLSLDPVIECGHIRGKGFKIIAARFLAIQPGYSKLSRVQLLDADSNLRLNNVHMNDLELFIKE